MKESQWWKCFKKCSLYLAVSVFERDDERTVVIDAHRPEIDRRVARRNLRYDVRLLLSQALSE